MTAPVTVPESHGDGAKHDRHRFNDMDDPGVSGHFGAFEDFSFCGLPVQLFHLTT